MNASVLQSMYILEVALFALVIFMHVAKKSSMVISLYVGQSLVVSGLLIFSAFRDQSLALTLVGLAMFFVKVLVAPYFLRRLINRHQIKFSASTYLSAPVTLIVVAALTALAFSDLLRPLALLAEENGNMILLAVAMILACAFLIINRKGALSQMIGILALENSIVLFAFAAGLEQAPSLEMGIIFDILVWVIIATVFAGMVYREFGSLDVSEMKHLKEE
jgi:hydrogenase-4 component E